MLIDVDTPRPAFARQQCHHNHVIHVAVGHRGTSYAAAMLMLLLIRH